MNNRVSEPVSDLSAGPSLERMDKLSLAFLGIGTVIGVLGATPFLIVTTLAVVWIVLVRLNGGPSIRVIGNRLFFRGLFSGAFGPRRVIMLDEITQVSVDYGRNGWQLVLVSRDDKTDRLNLLGIANSIGAATALSDQLKRHLGFGVDPVASKAAVDMGRQYARLLPSVFGVAFLTIGLLMAVVFLGMLR